MMKALVQKLSFGVLMGAALAAPATMLGQIDYYEDFSSDDNRNWTDLDFLTTNVAVCDNGYALRANPVNSMGAVVPVETVSPSLGVSNGEEVTLTYDYKLLYFDDVLPYVPVDDPDWGMFVVEYGPTQNGPWTQLDVILPEDHYISAECATRRVTFTPAEDEEVFLRITAGGGTNPDINYFVYVDNVSALQSTLSVAPIVTDGSLKAWPNPVNNYLNLDYNGEIRDVVIYNMQGQEVVVQNINNDLTRLDMSGLANGNYVLKIATDSKLETLNIVKR